MIQSLHKTMIKVLAVTCIASPIAYNGSLSDISAEQAVISTSNPYYNEVKAPILVPVWSSPLAILKEDRITGQNVTALAENGKVFALQQNEKLVALNATTGKKMWEFGSALAPLFTYSNGFIYGLTKNGSLYAVNEAGKKAWSASLSLPKATSIQRLGSTIYVTQESQFAAVDAVSGKIKWKAAEESNNFTGLSELMETDGVVIRSYLSQGALTTAALAAYDSLTGKKLWDHTRQWWPLAVKDCLLYSITNTLMMDDDAVNRNVKVSVFNVKTGELKGERLYKWTDTENKDGAFTFGGVNGTAFLDGNDFYIFQGKKLVKYDFWNYSAEGKPVQTWTSMAKEKDYPLNQVHQQRMLYSNYDTGTLSALKLGNGQAVVLNNGENPVVQTDLFGNVVYSGQSDGLFHAYDMLTLKPIFTVKTGSRNFAPSLKTGGMLIIRTDNKLLAIKLPSSIK
ncbi:PQQ-binding-like beta-propeller repeat protein [Paenibacillus sp. B2(2019)]|uniref:outer membrane protein assembly factor BamB family protein n=1 Tax=Paenibacillus sp. B2(2019) TaxID=2607754 RepID=UPI0011F30552|nr:PQQ-binding-like beta-propeller repeat protein [Paenibacillus sp. B2(2019)]KAA1191491.1 PQQ-like beta-propeller repeat protein [Paenibacillus sp. B2(2019)]